MATINKKPIHISVETSLKEEAEQLYSELGMNLTTAITIFLKQSIAEQGIPFKIQKANSETLQAIKDIEEGKLIGGFSAVSDLMDSLDG